MGELAQAGPVRVDGVELAGGAFEEGDLAVGAGEGGVGRAG